MVKTFLFRATFLFGVLGASTAAACPLCESETGERVRAGIFDGDFGYHVAVTLLPFPVFLGIVYLIHAGPPWGKAGSGEPTTHGTDETNHAHS